MREVTDFISNFSGAEDVFLNGCCYWFATILDERFDGRGYLTDILYEPVEGHFVTSIVRADHSNIHSTRLFDIRGDVTDLYWERYIANKLESMWTMRTENKKRYRKLLRDCRDFLLPEEFE